MRTLALLFLAPILLPACGPAGPEPEIPPAPTAAPTAAAVASVQPSAAPVAPPAKVADEPEPPSRFFPVAVHGARELRYFALPKGGIAVDGGYLSKAMIVDESGARYDARLYAGLKGEGPENAMFIYGVSGDWPRSGLLSLNLPGERGGTDVDYTWTGSSWVKTPDQPLGDMIQEVVSAYYQGGLLGSAKWGGKSLYYVITSDEKSDVTYQKFVPAKGAAKPPAIAKGTAKGCPTRLVGYAGFLNSPGGDMVGIGKLCTGPEDYTYYQQNGKGALAIERWAKGASKSTVAELPGSAGKEPLAYKSAGMLEIAPNDVYVYATFAANAVTATPYVAHWDGKAWADVSPKSKEGITTLWAAKDHTVWIETKKELFRRNGEAWERVAPDGVDAEIGLRATAPDGSQWVTFGKALWHLAAGGSWEKVGLPREGDKRFFASSVTWMGNETIIVARTAEEDESMLVSSKKPQQVLDLAAEDGGGKKPEPKKSALGRVGPPTAGCKSLFVVLYKLSRVAPPDFDFPLTREALKGHTELSDVRFAETEEAGTRYLVGFVPTVPKGQKLITLVQDKVKGSRPQLLCGEPQQNRVIDIDLRTGNLRKK